ncbi:MAG TPA: murein L,D-transpeptidase catalytic domain family protein [Ferruginibacter sp.]|nr:murein L,D-transpeptidase catalytic domain family protein [Ferruginibacter sp.]HMP22246.1 murein L,D-transpeptidase catalytic domain family protein [Ferruginibacter sp.]
MTVKNHVLKKVYLFFTSVFIFLLHLPFVFAKSEWEHQHSSIATSISPTFHFADTTCIINNDDNTPVSIYDSLRLGSYGLSRQVFDYALAGFNTLKETGNINNDNIISIIDFSKPSYLKRLYIIDITKYKLLFNTFVAHGMNSGKQMAMSFSNIPQSYKSSLGFYTTLNTYQGKHGYSLQLQGVEPGINDKAFDRDIVIHGAPYVNEQIIRAQGYLGRSQGCPAIPEKLHKPIINTIKNGTCLFIYGADKKYFSRSKILNGKLTAPLLALK